MAPIPAYLFVNLFVLLLLAAGSEFVSLELVLLAFSGLAEVFSSIELIRDVRLSGKGDSWLLSSLSPTGKCGAEEL